jgi:FkbM family methyltransferase
MTFYSQSGQDKILDTHVFKGYKRGFFVNIGAWDGVCFDNTLFFERELKWTGINIEPLPDRYQSLVENRPNCKNFNIAVSDRNGDAEFLAITGDTSMLSGIKENYDPRHLDRIARETAALNTEARTISVPVKRLDTLFKEQDVRRVHYMSIDAEGSEMNIIRSIDFNFTYIDVIDFENNYPDKTGPILEFLATKGYKRLPIAHGEDIFMIHNRSPFLP